MLIQEWVYLALAAYGFISLLLDLVKLSLWVDDKRLSNAAKEFNFEKRLHNGEVLYKDNIF